MAGIRYASGEVSPVFQTTAKVKTVTTPVAVPTMAIMILENSRFLALIRRRYWQLQELVMEVVHNAVHAEGVVLLPAILEVFPGVDRSEAAFLPLVVVANHLRPEQGLQSRLYRSRVQSVLLDEGVQVLEDGRNERRHAQKAEPLINRHSVTSSQP